jgi:hypothetical protein
MLTDLGEESLEFRRAKCMLARVRTPSSVVRERVRERGREREYLFLKGMMGTI